jgi:hypothetical protein
MIHLASTNFSSFRTEKIKNPGKVGKFIWKKIFFGRENFLVSRNIFENFSRIFPQNPENFRKNPENWRENPENFGRKI